MFQREDQILGVQFQLFEPYFLELFIFREVGLLNQLFLPLSVAAMFGLQAVYFFAQRGILDLIHQAPPYITEHLHIAPRRDNRQERRTENLIAPVNIWPLPGKP